jgi:carboxylesterase type B
MIQISKSRQDRKIGNLLPVMVFIHGGGWFFGSSSLYGPAYMMDQDVVLVSVNYRLGLFGMWQFRQVSNIYVCISSIYAHFSE